MGVSAIDTTGKVASYSSWGQGTTVAAVGGPVVVHNYESGNKGFTDGTSNSVPLVAGFLALAKQKWPNATSNQLLQLLTKTARTDQSGWNTYIGYGAVDPGAMINTDPSQYPDENPLMDPARRKGPTTEEVRQYIDGLVNPRDIAFDARTPTAGPTKASSATPTPAYQSTWAPAPATTPSRTEKTPRSRRLAVRRGGLSSLGISSSTKSSPQQPRLPRCQRPGSG